MTLPWGSTARFLRGPGSTLGRGRLAVALLRDAVGREGKSFALVVSMAVLAAALEGAALIFLPVLLDAGPTTGSSRFADAARHLGAPALVGLYLGLVGVGAALLYGQVVISDRLTVIFGSRLRIRLHEAVMRAGWGSAALARPTDLVHALTAEAGQCAYATQLALSLSTRLITVPPLMATTVMLSPELALAVAALALAAGLPMVSLAYRAHALGADMARAATSLHGALADDLSGIRAIKMLGAEPARGDALRRRIDGMERAQNAQTRATAAVQAWQRLAAAASAAAGAYYGLSVLRLDGAAMLALALAVARLAGALSSVLDMWRRLGRLLPIYEHLCAREARCREAEEPRPAARTPRLRRELRLRGIGYTHAGSPAPTLSGIDLTLPAHTITVLTGPSGSGKSTLADIVMGLLAPGSGEMMLDGTPLDGPGRVAWRARVAYVAQEAFLFHDTIRANLALARPDADADDVRAAIRAAVADFAFRFPEGLDTVVGSRGGDLSGGERQRITLVQAFLRDPDLLVIDEGTNAVDPRSEAEIVAALRRLARNVTVLVIAHRSAMINAADRVLRLDDGVISELRASALITGAPKDGTSPSNEAASTMETRTSRARQSGEPRSELPSNPESFAGSDPSRWERQPAEQGEADDQTG